jgi:hypothetical protein
MTIYLEIPGFDGVVSSEGNSFSWNEYFHERTLNNLRAMKICMTDKHLHDRLDSDEEMQKEIVTEYVLHAIINLIAWGTNRNEEFKTGLSPWFHERNRKTDLKLKRKCVIELKLQIEELETDIKKLEKTTYANKQQQNASSSSRRKEDLI